MTERTAAEAAFCAWAAAKDARIEELEADVQRLNVDLEEAEANAFPDFDPPGDPAPCSCCERETTTYAPSAPWVQCPECAECCPNYADRCRVEEVKRGQAK